VPIFLDLPFSYLRLLGSAPLDLLGLTLYYASIQSGCAYCTLHCCYFALARGNPPTTIHAPTDSEGVAALPAPQRAAARVAMGLASVPAKLSHAERNALRDVLDPHAAQHVVLAAAMMGFLTR
jgi:hypothetical protein